MKSLADIAPCRTCKHYSKKIYEVPCGGCLDLVMLSPYNPDKEPEFVFYQKNRPTVKSL